MNKDELPRLYPARDTATLTGIEGKLSYRGGLGLSPIEDAKGCELRSVGTHQPQQDTG